MKTHGISYCIHSFMLEELGLSGSELLIFAIIHSFTKGERGLFYGTLECLMRASGLSLSTVRRTLLKLLEKKYITESRFGERRGYKALTEGETLCAEEAETCQSTEAVTAEPALEENAEFDLTDRSLYPARPKYTHHSFGRYGLVSLTREQYKSLMTLVTPEVFHAYAHRLDSLIVNKGYRTFNPYKTIKKWIIEDNSA